MNKKELIKIIKDTSLFKGDFLLSSQKRSNYYIDKYLFETQPNILKYLAQEFSEKIDLSIDRLACIELGGVPLAVATALIINKPYIIVRKEKKEYGTSKQFEGTLNPYEKVLIIEDISTTGTQSVEAAKKLQKFGVKVESIFTVIDREEGAREKIEKAGFRFRSLITKSDLNL